MLIRISTDDGVPIYLQIVNQVKYLVAAGRLLPGDELPSIRALAETLGINPNTVARAYRELESAGVVEKRRTTGTYVAEAGSSPELRERLRLMNDQIVKFLEEAAKLGFTVAEVVDLLRHRGDPDAES